MPMLLRSALAAALLVLASTASAQTDPRVGLRAGLDDAGQAIHNLTLVAHVARPEGFVNPADPGDFGFANTDLAFRGDLLLMGNYHGVQMYDISDPTAPRLRATLTCPGGQGDISIHGDLLFMSVEETRGRVDCGLQGVEAPVSAERFRGVRIFDVSDVERPRQVAAVQTCRGSHTHTLVPDPTDPANLYVYVSGTSRVRSGEELAGCSRESDDPNSALFRIEVIRVPIATPEGAAVIASPRVLEGLDAAPEHGASQADRDAVERVRAAGGFIATVEGEDVIVPEQYVTQLLAQVVAQRGGTGAATAADSTALRAALPAIVAQMVGPATTGPRSGPDQCHDITAYPEMGIAGGACSGYGLLLDISNPANPTRIAAAADSNFAYWHSATFSNDARRVVFTDEWGGGSAPRCRATDRPEWGANALFDISTTRELTFRGYYKLPAEQTETENCVAHNGSLVPVPGRDLMVQAWYQGGLSVFDFTDPAAPSEVAYFDRGPISATELTLGGYWSVYWYNGYIYASEIGRGLDVFRLSPGDGLSGNEIAAAEAVQTEGFNPQTQTRITWPNTAATANAYIDGLERDGIFTADQASMTRMAVQSNAPAAFEAASTALSGAAAATQGRTSERLRALAETLAAMGGR